MEVYLKSKGGCNTKESISNIGLETIVYYMLKTFMLLNHRTFENAFRGRASNNYYSISDIYVLRECNTMDVNVMNVWISNGVHPFLLYLSKYHIIKMFYIVNGEQHNQIYHQLIELIYGIYGKQCDVYIAYS